MNKCFFYGVENIIVKVCPEAQNHLRLQPLRGVCLRGHHLRRERPCHPSIHRHSLWQLE